VGTAPGFIVEKNGSCVLSLPGVPRELYYLTEQTVLPFIKNKFDIQTIIKIRTLRTAGVGESNIDRMIDDLEESINPTVGLAAHPGSVDIRISAKAEDEKTAVGMLDDMEAKVRSRVGDIIFGIDKETIEQVVADLLRDQKLSISILETNTGGIFTARFTETAGGFHLLNKSQTTSIQKAVQVLLPDKKLEPVASAELSERLASILRTESDTDIGTAIIGDEDPDVGPFKKIPGNTFIGLSKKGHETSRHMKLGGITNDARTRITSFAFEVLRRFLLDL
jgi:nicotinamide-nucleotide amidase